MTARLQDLCAEVGRNAQRYLELDDRGARLGKRYIRMSETPAGQLLAVYFGSIERNAPRAMDFLV